MVAWMPSLERMAIELELNQQHNDMNSRLLKRVPLSIATWRSRMVCLSLSARIPGLELPDMFVRGLLLSPNIQPSGLFSSLSKSCSVFSSSIN
jgi:hypothetical protein